MKLYYETVTDYLMRYLVRIMNSPNFNDFRLVGGTSLALQIGHRKSVDIDLFTDIDYGTIDTQSISKFLQEAFPIVKGIETFDRIGLGYSVRIGDTNEELIKLDMYYTEKYIFPMIIQDGIRFASDKEVAAMKMQAITSPNPRKKDFWDICELLEKYSLNDMIEWGIERNPYSLTKEAIINSLKNINSVDSSEPINCIKDNYWELVVMDLLEAVKKIATL